MARPRSKPRTGIRVVLNEPARSMEILGPVSQIFGGTERFI